MSRVMRLKWKLLLGVVVVAVVVVGLLITGAMRKRAMAKAATRPKTGHTNKSTSIAQKATDESSAAASILVLVVGEGNPVATAETIASLFLQASFPLRVYVALCEHYVQVTDSALEEFRRLVKRNYDDHVHVIRIPRPESNGAMAARALLLRHHYSNEPFVMTVAPYARMARNWDVTLLSEYTRAVAEAVVAPRPVMLTTRPKVVPLASLQSSLNEPSSSRPGTFVVLGESDRGDDLCLRTATFAAMPAATVPAMAWCSALSFGPAGLYAYPPDIVHGDAFEDLWMTVRLNNVRLLHVPQEVAVVSLPVLPPKRSATALPAALLPTAQVMAGFLHGMGLDGGDDVALVRARKGLTPQCDEHEVLSKLGSNEELVSLVSRLELHRSRAEAQSPRHDGGM